MRYFLSFVITVFMLVALHAQQKRPAAPVDVYRLQNITNPQISPDGKWVLYILSTVDTVKDKRNRDLWMISWDGKEQVQLTNGPESESSPRFSPDGKYISFTASRDGDDKDKEEKKSQ